MANETQEEDLSVLDYGKLCIFVLMAAITIVGNSMLIFVIIRTPTIRSSVTSYFVASLAVANLIIGWLVMPLHIQHVATNERWYLGQVMCDLWHALDVLASTSSIWNLCIVSLDRYYAVSDALAYKNFMSLRLATLAIGAVWLTAAMISFPAIIWWRYDSTNIYSYSERRCEFTDSLSYLCFSSLVSFYVPLCIMLICYWRVYRAANDYEQALREDGAKQGVINEKLLKNVRKRDFFEERDELLADFFSVVTPPGSHRALNTLDYGSMSNGTELEMDEKPTFSIANGKDTDSSGKNINPVLSVSAQKATQLHQLKKEEQMRQTARTEFFTKLHIFSQQKKAAKMVGVVVCCFIICWLPFFILNVVAGLCPSCVNPGLFTLFTWLGYLNSGLNPILFAFCSKDYRKGFKKLLCIP